MRYVNLFFTFCLVLFVAVSCTNPEDNDETSPDFSSMITGTYSYTTYKGGAATGSGTAIISKTSNSRIRIGLQDGISFYADKLQRVDNDMIMEVPGQDVDYYGMKARFSGNRSISRGGSMYEGVYSGSNGELRIALQVAVGNQTDQITVVLDR
ncbi:hypothetical protein [Cesiribacter sp. SM1]|uniref:hypothetical protein n=1 Tax=Cesiribacter sp. SM1 TaxID=2861196 RepID=UPI001CD39B39|nr:hypothetical protein [Cesiribacter sp. SM1]